MLLAQEASQNQIQRILQSRTFRTSEVHRNLLNYLAEKSLSGTADEVKEYTLGLDVFGKPDSYDPRQESTVRMHVSRLRQKLTEYYRTEGASDSVIIDLPKGGFRVTFETKAIPEIPVVGPPEVVNVPPQRRLAVWILAGALTLAVVAAGYFAVRLWNVQNTASQVAGLTPELQELWGPILSTNRPLILCLAAPSDSFPGLGAASGAFLLGQFLSKHQNVILTPSDELSAPEIAMGNVVFLGPMGGNRQIQALPAKQELVLDPKGIRILNPRAGESSILTDKIPADSLDVEESYALISHMPSLYDNGEILYISGNRIGSIMGGVKAFTDSTFAKSLLGKMKAAGKLPAYYQIVLRVRAMNDMPLDYAYVLHRELLGAAPQKSAN